MVESCLEFLPQKYSDNNTESVRLEVWKKCMENYGAVQWPDANGAARQAKLRLLMLNQTGKARDFVFESIADNVLWAEACEPLKEFEGQQVRHYASEKIKGQDVQGGKRFKTSSLALEQADLQLNDSQKLSCAKTIISEDVADVAAGV